MNELPTYPCPCCGRLVFGEPPGSYAICPICFWEDDIYQLRFPTMGGANRVSLVDGQKNYREFHACELEAKPHVRAAKESEPLEPEWRPVDPVNDAVEHPVRGGEYGSTYPADSTTLYYWRPTFWRRNVADTQE